MKRKSAVVLLLVAVGVAGAGAFFWTDAPSQKASAQAPRAADRVVGVTVATVEKKPVPLKIDALGTVTTMANVAIKPRVDSEIVAVKFEDGARVKQGDVLFVLDARSIQSDIKRVEAALAGSEAQLEQASRDVQRFSELVAKNATSQVTLANAQTQVNVIRAQADSSRATLEGLKVQLSYTQIRAPIAGRISMANAKVGNIVRQADAAPLATINQTAPIYVSFTVPQRVLADVRAALAAETAAVDAAVAGSDIHEGGQIAMVENTVDPATGMVTVRAVMPNEKETLWPGSLVNTVLTLRADNRLTVPAAAVQLSQTGSYVYVIKDGAATVRPVTVDRTVDGVAAIGSGLQEGEVVVTDGQLQLSNGTRVQIRSGQGGQAQS